MALSLRNDNMGALTIFSALRQIGTHECRCKGICLRFGRRYLRTISGRACPGGGQCYGQSFITKDRPAIQTKLVSSNFVKRGPRDDCPGQIIFLVEGQNDPRRCHNANFLGGSILVKGLAWYLSLVGMLSFLSFSLST